MTPSLKSKYFHQQSCLKLPSSMKIFSKMIYWARRLWVWDSYWNPEPTKNMSIYSFKRRRQEVSRLSLSWWQKKNWNREWQMAIKRVAMLLINSSIFWQRTIVRAKIVESLRRLEHLAINKKNKNLTQIFSMSLLNLVGKYNLNSDSQRAALRRGVLEMKNLRKIKTNRTHSCQIKTLTRYNLT